MGLHKFLKKGLSKRWRHYRKAYRRCAEKFSETRVHELRVETRRMLAFLSLLDTFSTEESLLECENRFRKLFKSSASLRDTQVQLQCIEDLLPNFPELKPFGKWLDRREKRFTKALRRRVRGKPNQSKMRRCIRSLKSDLRRLRNRTEAAHERSLLHAVALSYSAVMRLRHSVRAEDVSTIHRMRVAFKKFRYMVEALQSLLKGVDERRIQNMQAYQTRMGEIQDAEVLLDALDRYTRKTGDAQRRFRSHLRARHTRLIAEFIANADQVRDFWPIASKQALKIEHYETVPAPARHC